MHTNIYHLFPDYEPYANRWPPLIYFADAFNCLRISSKRSSCSGKPQQKSSAPTLARLYGTRASEGPRSREPPYLSLSVEPTPWQGSSGAPNLTLDSVQTVQTTQAAYSSKVSRFQISSWWKSTRTSGRRLVAKPAMESQQQCLFTLQHPWCPSSTYYTSPCTQ